MFCQLIYLSLLYLSIILGHLAFYLFTYLSQPLILIIHPLNSFSFSFDLFHLYNLFNQITPANSYNCFNRTKHLPPTIGQMFSVGIKTWLFCQQYTNNNHTKYRNYSIYHKTTLQVTMKIQKPYNLLQN